MHRLITLHREQVERLPFPIGSKVCINEHTNTQYEHARSQSQSRGTVSGASLRISPSWSTTEILFKIDLNTRGGKKLSQPISEMHIGTHLRFQNGSRVGVRVRGSKSGDDTKMDILEGIVLGTTDVPNDDRNGPASCSFLYSIQLFGSDDDDDDEGEGGTSETTMHEVFPGDVVHRTIPTEVVLNNKLTVDDEESLLTPAGINEQPCQDQNNGLTALKLGNEISWINQGEDVIELLDCETQTTTESLPTATRTGKRQREEHNGGTCTGVISLSPMKGFGDIAELDSNGPQAKRRCRISDLD